jgi:hypothetical protein
VSGRRRIERRCVEDVAHARDLRRPDAGSTTNRQLLGHRRRAAGSLAASPG